MRLSPGCFRGLDPGVSLLAKTLAISALFSAFARTPAHAGQAPGDLPVEAGQTVEDWVAGLGSPHWKIREACQARILQAGLAAVPALEGATLSDNPELAARARYLLERLDPEIVRVEVAEISAGAPARVASAVILEGRPGEELRAVEATNPSAKNEFTASVRVGADGALEFSVERGARTQEPATLRTPFSLPERASLLEVSDRAIYQRLGLELTRIRDIRVTVAWVLLGRASRLPPARDAALASARTETWVERLFRQARASNPSAREEALEILAALQLPEAETLFREAASDPGTRTLSELALGEAEAARELIEKQLEAKSEPAAPLRPEASRGLAVPWLAALRLVGREGAPAAAEFAATIPKTTFFDAHLTLSFLSDLAASGKLSPAELDALLRLALSPETIRACSWDDPETERFYARLIDLADASDPEVSGLLRSSLESLEKLPDVSLPRPRLEPVFYTWLRAAKRIGKADVGEIGRFFRSVIEGAQEGEIFSEMATLVERHLGGIAEEAERSSEPREGSLSEFVQICEALCRHVELADPDGAAFGQQALLRLSQTRRLLRGELRPLVEILVRSGVAQDRALKSGARTGRIAAGLLPSLLRQTQDELTRLSGVAPRQVGGSEAPVGDFDPGPWRQWLADPKAAPEREERLLQVRTSGTASDRRYALYHFDLEIEPKSQPGNSPRRFRVLDGRRVELIAGKPVRASDRWGNSFYWFLEPMSPPGQSAPQRVRVNRRVLASLETPFVFQPESRPVEVRAYQASDASQAVRLVPSSAGTLPELRAICAVLAIEEDPLADGEAHDVAVLWKGFVERLLRIEPGTTEEKISATLTLFSELDLEGRSTFLRSLLAVKPSVEVARALHAAGDPEGLRFLRERLASPDPNARVQAAMALAELSDAEGTKTLLRILREDLNVQRRYGYSSLNLLDAQLRELPPEDPARVQILDFILECLSNPSLHYRVFAILQRELGSDFGFRDAAAQGDAARRKKAVDEAISRAREAWMRARSGSGR